MEQSIKEIKVLFYSEIFDEYGILFPGDDETYLQITFCPWCGRKLPSSKREEWFEKLEQLGFDDPLFDDSIPTEFKSSEWRDKTD